VPIMDVAEYLGRPYYIMSYINGGSLDDLLNKQGKISIDQALEIIIKLLTALSEMHRKGIIHRDIKPDNVILDESGEPILIDFGIARMEEGNKAKTGTGFSIGTPAYMSPEQLDGNIVNHQTDLYSIGILLFELITGNPPYEGNLSSIIKQQQSEAIPSIGTDGNLKIDFIKDIDLAIKKACAKNLNTRFDTAEKMRDVLDNLSLRLSEEKLNEYLKTNQNEAKSNVSQNINESLSEDWNQYEKVEEKSNSKYFQNNIKKIGLLFSAVFVFIFLVYFQFVRSNSKDNEITNEKINNSKAIEISSTVENPLHSS